MRFTVKFSYCLLKYVHTYIKFICKMVINCIKFFFNVKFVQSTQRQFLHLCFNKTFWRFFFFVQLAFEKVLRFPGPQIVAIVHEHTIWYYYNVWIIWSFRRSKTLWMIVSIIHYQDWNDASKLLKKFSLMLTKPIFICLYLRITYSEFTYLLTSVLFLNVLRFPWTNALLLGKN